MVSYEEVLGYITDVLFAISILGALFTIISL
jgi:hypothetical protein